MKKILIASASIIFFSGCGAPKIMSQKSPMLDIDQNNCFIFPSKEYLVTKPISEQKVYKLTEKVLDNKAYKVYYGSNKECKNYLLTKTHLKLCLQITIPFQNVQNVKNHFLS